MRKFRAERIDGIVAGNLPVSLIRPPSFVFHIIPASIINPSSSIDLVAFEKNRYGVPILETTCKYRINDEGILAYGKQWSDSPGIEFCLQVFDNGVFEIIYTQFLDRNDKLIDHFYEYYLINELTVYLRLEKTLGMSPPFFATLSLLNVKDYIMDFQSGYFQKIGDPSKNIGFAKFDPKRQTPITKNNLLTPETKIDGFDCDPAKELQPIFNRIWRAAGWPQSMNYDSNGIIDVGIKRIS